MKTIILPFDRINMKELSHAGRKNASLGEMIKNLSARGIRIPPCFVITVEAYREFLSFNKLTIPVSNIFQKINREILESLDEVARQDRNVIMSGCFPSFDYFVG